LVWEADVIRSGELKWMDARVDGSHGFGIHFKGKRGLLLHAIPYTLTTTKTAGVYWLFPALRAAFTSSGMRFAMIKDFKPCFSAF